MAKQEKYADLADKIIDLMGGKSNISFFTHCVTRLRFNVKDKGLVKKDEIEKLRGAVGAQWSGDQFQVIIGNDVEKAYNLVCDVNGIERKATAEGDDEANVSKKGFSPKKIIDAVVGCILPAIPVMVGGALLNTLAVVLNLTGVLATDSQEYLVLYNISQATMYFMPIFVAYTAAQYFHASPVVAMGLCTILVAPDLVAGLADGSIHSFLGIPIYPGTYGSLLFPSVIIVWLMSYVERFFKKVVPTTLAFMLVPFCTLLIMAPISLLALAPLGYFIGSVITGAVMFIYEHLGFIGVGLLTAIYPFLVMTGMHYAVIPAMGTCFLTWGYDPLICPAMYLYNFCMVGVNLGIMFKTKIAERRADCTGLCLTVLLSGITEPTLFGVALRYRKPLIALVAGGFVAGSLLGLLGGGVYAAGGTGVLSVLAFISANPSTLVAGLVAAVAGVLITTVVTAALYRDDDAAASDGAGSSADDITAMLSGEAA